MDEQIKAYSKSVDDKINKTLSKLTFSELDHSIIYDLYFNKRHTSFLYTDISDQSMYGYKNNEENSVMLYRKNDEFEVKNKWEQIQAVLGFFNKNIIDYFEIPTRERCERAKKIAMDSLDYEALYGKSLIDTGEIGEIYAGYLLDLHICKSKITPGFDALDKDMNRVQIKTRRTADTTIGTLTKFSSHHYDYCLLVVLNHDYSLREIYKAEKEKLNQYKGRITGENIISKKTDGFQYNPFHKSW